MEIVTGVLLIALGLVAISMPLVTSLGVSFLVVCVLGTGGVVHLYRALAVREFSNSSIIVQAFVGFMYLAIAIALLLNPLWSVTTIALVVSATFVAEGVVALVGYFVSADAAVSLWLLMGALVSIAIGFVGWSVSLVAPAAVVAALVGVNLIASGAGRVMTGVDERRFREA